MFKEESLQGGIPSAIIRTPPPLLPSQGLYSFGYLFSLLYFNLSFPTSIFPRLQTLLANILFLCFPFQRESGFPSGGEKKMQTCHLPFLTYPSFLNSLRSGFCYHWLLLLLRSPITSMLPNSIDTFQFSS